MEPMIETNMGITLIFILALAWFFLRKFSAKPFDKTLKLAAAGNAKAQYDMGYFYYQGKQVKQDFVQAFNWFDTSMVALAGLYNEGKGCEKSPEKAFYCYQEAAKTGDFEARVNLAVCYLQGTGTEKDETRGAQILKTAADEKSPLAQTLLADLYERGVGVEKNEEEALRYYIMAAKQGEPLARKKLEGRKGK